MRLTGNLLSIIPPHARHAVFAITHSMMSGIHFYHFRQYDRSVLGWIHTRFASSKISNAEHFNFLSLLQAFATFWEPAFTSKETKNKQSTYFRCFANGGRSHISHQSCILVQIQTRRRESRTLSVWPLRTCPTVHSPGRTSLWKA